MKKSMKIYEGNMKKYGENMKEYGENMKKSSFLLHIRPPSEAPSEARYKVTILGT